MRMQDKILEQIKQKPRQVYCLRDLAALGNYKALSKALERLTQEGILNRILPGIYGYRLLNPSFAMEEPVDLFEVSKALARSHHWQILPTGVSALNFFGLSTQIPATYCFLSSGPYISYLIGKSRIVFKRAAPNHFAVSEKSGLVFEALRSLGKNNIQAQDLRRTHQSLSEKEIQTLAKETCDAPLWMQSYLHIICENKA
jgi:hypothetical protein